MKKTKKYQIWYEISKIAGVMHTCIFVGRALGAKIARHCGEKHNFEGGMKRTKSEANGQKSDNSTANTKKTIFAADWGSKNWNFALTKLTKSCSATRAGSTFPKKWATFARKRCVKHQTHKERSRSHTKFKKMQVVCIRSFLQTGLGGEKCTRLEAQAVFEGGTERTHGEPNEQRSDKSKQKWQKLLLSKPFGGQKSDILMENVRSGFAKMCFPLRREAHFWKMWFEKWVRTKDACKIRFATYIFDAYSHQGLSRISFLQLARHWLVFFENHKIQVDGRFGAAGRNARGRWGRFWGG